jgi:predicted kinase
VTVCLPAVVVLVGPSASGRTTFRRALVAAGLPESSVVSLDDLRRDLRDAAVAAGRPGLELQDWTARALRVAGALQAALLDEGAGYVADATHLRRRERTAHVRAAHAAGLHAIALLLDERPLQELVARNAARPAGQAVPEAVLSAMAHRRSLLSAGLLANEGFDVVLPVGVHTRVQLVRTSLG